MSGPRYLFDASSLVLALKESRLELLEGAGGPTPYGIRGVERAVEGG